MAVLLFNSEVDISGMSILILSTRHPHLNHWTVSQLQNTVRMVEIDRDLDIFYLDNTNPENKPDSVR